MAAVGSLPAIAAGKTPADISWEQFLELCQQLSKSQFEPDWDQTTYTRQVQQLLLKLNVADSHIQQVIQRYRNFNSRFPEIRYMHNEQQFMVAMLEFEPGEEIGLHDHPDMTGVTFCTEGKLQVEHYDLLDRKSDSGNPLLKQQQKLVMGKGDSAILTADRGNIHTLKADSFTRLIDVFTPPYNWDRTRRVKNYRKDSKPYQGKQGVFEAEITR